MVTSNQFSLTKFGPSDHEAAPSLAGGGSQPINAFKKFKKKGPKAGPSTVIRMFRLLRWSRAAIG